MCNKDERARCALCDKVIEPGIQPWRENGKTYHFECWGKSELANFVRCFPSAAWYGLDGGDSP